MGSGKRQAFSRGGNFRGLFEGVLSAYLRRNGREAPLRATREATLSECITAPLARLSLDGEEQIFRCSLCGALSLAVRWKVCAQLEPFGRGKDPAALPAIIPLAG